MIDLNLIELNYFSNGSIQIQDQKEWFILDILQF